MPCMPRQPWFVISVIVLIAVIVGAFLYRTIRPTSVRAAQVFAWIKDPSSRPELVTAAGSRCGTAPFVFPTTGVPGFIWDDSFQVGHRHQGIDIFAGTDIDVTAVEAAYPGFLTRLPEWKSSVIIRVPSDPLNPGRQIWVYYTHMADPNGNSFISSEFPPGTHEKPVEAGVELGRQGDYSGDPNNPVGVHLHISIVKDNAGQFMNELDINNTYDPSPYFGMALNARKNPDKIPVCEPGTSDQ
jgi:peptidoglycan LD-endopeptidase LytH